MGSGGKQFDPADSDSAARLNQKTIFVGTGADINGISVTYAGMMAFCTSTGSGFTVEHYYIRNSANAAWVDYQTVNTSPIESSESNSTPVADNADFTVTAGYRYYAFFTMPSTAPLYIITGIEWKNGATVAGNVFAGIDLIDGDPAVSQYTPLIAISQEVAQAGTSVVQRVSIVGSCPIRAGTIIGGFVSCSSSSAKLRELTGLGSQNQLKQSAYTPNALASEGTAWTTATARKYLKIYYRAYQ